MKICKYFDKHLETIREYIRCLYNLEGCRSGGLLHILLDDDNYENEHILSCLNQCIQHPEREESKIGRLICEEYLRLSMEQRRLLRSEYIGNWMCKNNGRCEECLIQIGDEYEEVLIMTNRECAIIMAYTGITMLTGDKLKYFYEYVSEILGKPVRTDEFYTKMDEIREKSKSDFMHLCAEAQ